MRRNTPRGGASAEVMRRQLINRTHSSPQHLIPLPTLAHAHQPKKKNDTHIRLHIQILQIKRMLPHVDADHGEMREQRVLVRRRRDLQLLGRRVHALECRTRAQMQIGQCLVFGIGEREESKEMKGRRVERRLRGGGRIERRNWIKGEGIEMRE